MSRPSKGVKHVDSLDGEAASKARLRIVLETIAGTLSVEEACERLSVSASRFHEIREQALEGALRAIEPRPPGRPASPAEDSEVKRLREEVRRLEVDLEAARIRTEIAIAMPQVLRPREGGEKGGSQAPPRRGGRSGT